MLNENTVLEQKSQSVQSTPFISQQLIHIHWTVIVPMHPKADLVVAFGGNPRLAARLHCVGFIANPVHRSIVPLLLDVDVSPEVQVHRSSSVQHVAQGEGVPHLRNRIPIT